MRGTRRVHERTEAPEPGRVKFRMMGSRADLIRAALVMDELIRPGVIVEEVSGPYENRREPGCRVYVTLRIDPDPRYWPGQPPGQISRPRPEIGGAR